MAARILDGQKLAEALRQETADAALQFSQTTGVRPQLAAIIVGNNPASEVYVRNKRRACEKAGFASALYRLPATANPDELLALLQQLNADREVHGILLQLPLPPGFDERTMLHAIDPRKDVDAFHPYNVGLLAEGFPRFLPCTPAGIQQLLLREQVPLAGADVVIVGRSNLVGKPLALMLGQKGHGGDATVTLCHRRTRDVAGHLRRADILVAAIGQAQFVTREMVKPGAIVIDVGINRTGDGKLVGDVDFAGVAAVAGAITPVPGGVGPMTITMLLANTLKAARLQAGVLQEGNR